MRTIQQRKQSGFTIVELLIVIVVIGILAAITIVAYNGVQQRARDSRRASDATTILKALELYKTANAMYPAATSTAGTGSYEASTETAGTFMEYLQPIINFVPVDPTNDASHYFRYYRYNVASLATYGCDATRGNLMVFFAFGFENAANRPKNSDPLVCPGASWSGGATYFFKYSFENG